MDLFTVLFIIFLVLKLVGLIAWSWWFVFAPLYVPILLLFLIHIFEDR